MTTCFSSNINEVIKEQFQAFLFFYEEILHTKKSIKCKQVIFTHKKAQNVKQMTFTHKKAQITFTHKKVQNVRQASV